MSDPTRDEGPMGQRGSVMLGGQVPADARTARVTNDGKRVVFVQYRDVHRIAVANLSGLLARGGRQAEARGH